MKKFKTSNNQHPTLNIQCSAAAAHEFNACWMLDVGCWMFPIPS